MVHVVHRQEGPLMREINGELLMGSREGFLVDALFTVLPHILLAGLKLSDDTLTTSTIFGLWRHSLECSSSSNTTFAF